ncbi:MAG TPA: carboxypeptidase regulatory-like domain-containing protein, partial [Phycisphaerales bacterium]|nr:carboxypeptidase regulatory-like domain-containing protein [Phycisphaerales bacterium]
GEPIPNETVYISRVQGPNGRLGTYHLGGGFDLAPVIGGLDNCMVTTDLAGCFEVADLLAGEYTVFVNRITARKRGWSAEQVRVQVPENETQSVTMYAVRAGYLNVEVIEKGSESKPVEGVTVRIEPWVGEAQTDPAGQTISGVSDEQGRVKFQLIPGTYRLVSVGKDGQWADLREDHVLEITSGQTASVRIPFTALQGVMGTAFDPEGNPLVGAEVFILPDRTQVSVSDEEGRFLLPEEVVAEDPDARSPEAKAQTETVMDLARQGAPATAIRDLLAVMPKPPPDARLLVARHEPRKLLGMRLYDRSTRISGPLKIQLQPEKSVIGRVVDAEGKPIADALVVVELVRVDLTGTDEVPYVTVTERLSDDEGRFEFPAVPLERGQVGYRVTASATGLGERAKLLREDPARAGTGGIPQIDLAPPAIDLGDFLLAPADLSVGGIVVDKYGRPLQKTTVTLESQGQGLKQTMETDPTGRFEFDGLQPGPVHLWAAVVWKGAGADVEAGTQDIRIVLMSDEVTDEIVADGFAGGAACEIRLVDAVTGEPIVDKQARLTIKQERGNTVYLDVDKDGLGRICLGQGTHEIGAQPKNYQYGKRRVTVEDSRVYQWDIEIKPKAEFEAHRTYGDAVYPSIRRDGQWIQQTPKPSVSTLRVNVKDRKTREPVVGAVVVVTFREGSGRYEASVNEKGYANCAILEGGTYVIESVRAEGYEDLTPNRTYQLSPWSDRPIEFLLEPQPVFVTVSVVDKHGRPVPNAWVKQCYRLGDKWEHAKQGRTDEDGRVQLEWIAEPAEGEPRVDHFLQVKDMRRPYGVLYAGIVRARQNDTIALPEQPQVIPKGRIVDSQGSPLAKHNVNVLCVETGWRLDFGYAQTDANGAFEIQPMPVGWDYKVVCTHGGQPHEWPFAAGESDTGYLDLGDLVME